MNAKNRRKATLKSLIKLRPLVAALASAALLAGCQTIPTIGTKYIPCSAVDPIRYSGSKDTSETVAGAQDFNAVYDAMCK